MTPSALMTATARHLRVLGRGATLGPDDHAILTAKYASLHAMLLEKRLVSWALTESIPTSCDEPVMRMLAAMSADEFGVAEPRYTRLIVLGALGANPASLAEKQLRAALAPAHVEGSVVTTYF